MRFGVSSSTVICGKILRIDPMTGDGLPSNPFWDATVPRSARSRVYALGFRNPYRMTLRPGTGSHSLSAGDPGVLYVGDVGWNTVEELNVVTSAGQNFGWPLFEGYDPTPNPIYAQGAVENRDAPNPLAGTAGCPPFFHFGDLIVEAGASPVGLPNPCDPLQSIPAMTPAGVPIFTFEHTRPAVAWNHEPLMPTTPVTDGTWVLTRDDMGGSIVVPVGDASGVPGDHFYGAGSVGGIWYTGTDLPPEYHDTYFHADYARNWIANIAFDGTDTATRVSRFTDTSQQAIVALQTHPVDGGLYYLRYTPDNSIRRITFGGNRPPVARIAPSQTFVSPSASPRATVTLQGDASSDPDGLPLTYHWDFGDGTHSSEANPTHVYKWSNTPRRYDARLTVTDIVPSGVMDLPKSSTTTTVVSINNTPPNVDIISPAPGARYSLQTFTEVDLVADVTDAEHGAKDLTYAWRVTLHHNDHTHPEAADPNPVTSTLLSPTACDATYYYRITLTVTDAAGLSTTDEVIVSPEQCRPIGHDDEYVVVANGTLSVPAPGLIANDFDGNDDPLSILLDTNPSDGALTLTGGGGFTYTPNPGFVGVDGFTYRVTDGFERSDLTHVTIEVNAAPIALADAYVVGGGTTHVVSATYGVLRNDTDSENDPLTAELLTDVSQGWLTFHTDGSFIYVPIAGFSGADSFTYRTSDGTSVSNAATVTLTVVATNRPPVVSAPVMVVCVGDPVGTVVGQATAIDPDGDAVTFRLNLADSYEDWSLVGQQGAVGWLYGYFDRTADVDGVYDVDDFTCFPPAAWNGFAFDLDYPGGNPPWTLVGRTAMHPNAAENGGEHWAIRRFTSPVAGEVSIDWALEKYQPNGTGLTLRVFVDGAAVETLVVAGNDDSLHTGTTTVTLQAGSVIDFAIDPNGPGGSDDASDGCNFGAIVRPVGFAIDATTGVITVADAATTTTAASHDLVVTATDDGMPPLRASTTVLVHVSDGSNLPPRITDQNVTVAANAAAGTSVATVVVEDPDTGDAHSFSIAPIVVADSFADWSNTSAQGIGGWYYGFYDRTADADGVYADSDFQPFSAEEWTGSVFDAGGHPPWTLVGQERMHPNGSPGPGPAGNEQWAIRRYVLPTDGIFVFDWFVAKEAPGGGDGVTAAVYVDGSLVDSVVLAGNDTVGQTCSYSPGNMTMGTIVDFVLAPTGPSPLSDPYDTHDASLMSVTVSAPVFGIDINGTITVGQSGVLLPGVYAATVTVTDDGTPSLTDEATMTFEVVSGANQPPVVTSHTFTVSVSDPVGTVIGTIAATDPEGDPTSFDIGGVVVADSVADWSDCGDHGVAGWTTGYYDRAADVDSVFATDDFLPFPASSWTGAGFELSSAPPPWTSAMIDVMHPNAVGSGGEHWAIRRFTTPAAGTYTIDWTLAKHDAGGTGVTGRVMVDGVSMDARTIGGFDTEPTTRRVTLSDVGDGEVVDLVLDPLGLGGDASDAFDKSHLTARVERHVCSIDPTTGVLTLMDTSLLVPGASLVISLRVFDGGTPPEFTATTVTLDVVP